jgi:endonuclease I
MSDQPMRILKLAVVLTGLVALLGMEPRLAVAQQTINEARQQSLGTEVTVTGTVTRAYGAYVRLQDTSGPTGASAIVLRQTSGTNSDAFQGDIADGTIQPGTTLEVTGGTSAFNGLLQINNDDLSSYTVQGQGTPPSPQAVTLAELAQNGEDYESELVRIGALRVPGASGSFQNGTTYTVENDAGTSFEVRVQDAGETDLGGTEIPKSVFAYEGVVGQYNGAGSGANLPNDGYQLIPVRPSDLQATSSFRFGQTFAIAEEDGSSVSVDVQALNTGGDEVTVTVEVDDASTANEADVTGFQSPQTLTFSGSAPAPQTLMLTATNDAQPEGVERLEVTLSSSDGAISSPGTFTLWLLDNATAQAPIAEDDSSGALVDTLRVRYGNPPTLGYEAARDSLYRSILNDQGTVETIYGGFEAAADPNGDATSQLLNQDVNTEHLWPRSKGAENEPALSNMYILAPAWAQANSYRCNYPYAEIDDAITDRWITGKTVETTQPPSTQRAVYTESVGNTCGSPSSDGRLEPRHSKKGDVARAMFYFVMAYPNRADLPFFEAQRATLLDWHQQDPVNATELRRSLVKASYQGNKANPFILDSTLAERAYGVGVPDRAAIPIQEARELGAGRTATVEGVVTRVGADGPYLQDDTGGLYIFESQGVFGQALGSSIEKGTRLKVTGTLTYFNGLLELTDVPDDGFEIMAQGETLPSPTTLTLQEVAAGGEEYEAELVRVEDLTIDAGGDETFVASKNYTVDDGTGTLTLRIPGGSALEGEPIPDRVTFQGPLGQFNGEGPDADTPDSGYQLLAIETGDLIEELPAETTIDVTRSFGDPATGAGYRLVALPGQIDTTLAATLDGANGVEWEAYWDDGSAQDYFVKFDASDTFSFRPGRGFWLLSTSDWSVQATVPTVPVTNGTTTVDLQDGWNIVSNPLPMDVSWSEVEAANGRALQALWRWDGSAFENASTFASATAGRAFYFLNDQGLDQLAIPDAQPSSTVRASHTESVNQSVSIVAEGASGQRAQVHVATHADARTARDRYDWIAPPSRFAPLSFTLQAPFEGAPARERRLARDVRAAGADGHSYTLRLRADTTGPVTLRAASMPTSPETRAVLLHPRTGERHALREGGMTVGAGAGTTQISLLVGTAAFVNTQAEARAPETLTVDPPAPNPVRSRATLRYALPETRRVRIDVFDLLGRRVQTVVDERQNAGWHRATWEPREGARGQMASGPYLIRWTAGDEQHVEKVVLIR